MAVLAPGKQRGLVPRGRILEDVKRRDSEGKPHNFGVFASSGLAFLGALVSIGAAVGTFSQIDVAKRQNEISDRQSLAALVANITEQTRMLARASGPEYGSIEQTRLADAEEALALTNTLKVPVPAIDYYEMGEAFVGFDDFDGIVSYERAADARNDPHVRSGALRVPNKSPGLV